MEKDSYADNQRLDAENPNGTSPQNDFYTPALSVIKPFDSWFTVDWQNVWNYRELLYFLIWRDVKVRYKQTFLGIAWVILQPLVTTLIFTILFSRLSAGTQTNVSYSLIVFSGFVFWSFINAAVNNASNSLVNYSNLITKVYFPRLLVPIAGVGGNLLDYAINLLLFFIVAILFGAALTWKLLLLPPLIILTVLLVLGLGIMLSALNVLFRDVRQILLFALQVWMFASPVFYTLEILPQQWRWVWKLNPLAGILENFRASVFGLDLDLISLSISIVFTLIILAGSIYVFNRLENDFADVI